jgi:hypothetical protein
VANVKQIIRDIRSLDEQITGLQSVLTTSKEKVHEYFDKHGIKELEVEPDAHSDEPALIAKKVERITIDYYADKLKESLSKEVYNEVVNKTHTITNIDGLITLLKKAGIKPNEFKQYINTSVSVNKEALKQLYAVGDIKKEELQGCYSAKIVKSIQIKERKGDTD